MERTEHTDKEAGVKERQKPDVYTDYLTELANRLGLYEYYNNISENTQMHFMFIDIDNFKRVNDIYGHGMGDKLLVEVGKLIKRKFKNSFISRIGGDEFVVAIDGKYKHEIITERAQNLIDGMSEMDFRKDILSLISLSIGIIFDQSTEQILDEILYKCDSAMYHAKSNGKNKFVVYYAIEKSVEVAKTIETEMENALNNGEFKIYFQPRVNMITSRVTGAEALVRWEHPVDGVRSPEMFIPLFEKNGFVKKLDIFVFETVCRLKSSWKGKPYEHLVLSLNISRLHLYQNDLPEYLLSIAEKYDIPANEINFEIRENIFIKDSAELINMTKRLQQAGFKVSIDNFGSGYSALNMLKDITANTINIDGNFLRLSFKDQRGSKVLKNVFIMCRDLKFEVVAIGVENEEQINFAISCGCEVAQGNYYCKPVSQDRFEEYLETRSFSDEDYISFSFENGFESDCGNYEGRFIGNGYEFVEGVIKDKKALRFPGGEKTTNYLELPESLLYHESYTISMWIRPERVSTWTSALYIKMETGFVSICPLITDGNASFRVRDARVINGFYDTMCCRFPLNIWTNVTVSYNADIEQVTLYINGKLVGISENIPILYFTKNVMLGGDIYQDSFKGDIAEFTVFNQVKTPTEIKEHFLKTALDKDFVYASEMHKGDIEDLFFGK